MANFKYYNNQNKGDTSSNRDWKMSKDDNFRSGSNPGSHFSRDPSSVKGGQLSPRQLEERFCADIGGVSWQEVVENQKYLYQHENILKWNDSAVEEAFWDAKNRFLAKIRGQPCDIELPNPDMYIDKIDWNSTIDPKLLSDLENLEFDGYGENDQQDGGVIVGIPSTVSHSDLTPNGWGDAEQVKPQPENEQWVDSGVKREEVTFSNSWENDYVNVTHNMAGREENGPTWNGYRKKQDYGHEKHYERGNHTRLYNGYNRKGDHGGWSTSRYKISRFEHNNYSRPLDNFGGQKVSYSCERPNYAWKPITRRR